ncbi:hypothetical protein KNP414_01208 [Paenibacillus mucilaginosus KNP414]|uniref:Uncharacterized protein n=1 Tax=Paenibacillus mucilaginosus (strain KNP414) TaxID=1036673 RepID=F8FH73_PAEMK|nr:hypothetical protein KNP414_01208 [Paenibacillus mucilaginosus KNP414]
MYELSLLQQRTARINLGDTFIPERDEKNYPIVREILAVLSSNKLLYNEAVIVLDQVKAIIGYVRV